jgi:hypothetical protein
MMEMQELIHSGPPWRHHDDMAALCVIIFCLSIIGIYLFLSMLDERIR